MGDAMLFRSILGLGVVVLLLPPATDTDVPAPHMSLWQTIGAARALATDAASVCERKPDACETSRHALTLLHRKIETGVDIVAVGIERSRAVTATKPSADAGTLTAADRDLLWSAPLPKSRG